MSDLAKVERPDPTIRMREPWGLSLVPIAIALVVGVVVFVAVRLVTG